MLISGKRALGGFQISPRIGNDLAAATCPPALTSARGASNSYRYPQVFHGKTTSRAGRTPSSSARALLELPPPLTPPALPLALGKDAVDSQKTACTATACGDESSPRTGHEGANILTAPLSSDQRSCRQFLLRDLPGRSTALWAPGDKLVNKPGRLGVALVQAASTSKRSCESGA